MEAKGQETPGRGQPAETVRQLVDELVACFANISAAAESLKAKVEADGESSLKADVEEIIQVARSTVEKLSRFSRTWLAGAPQSEPPGLVDETLPEFAHYVRRKHGVELEEDLVTMIEDLIERQKQKVKACG
jgi:hypothetical protein